MHQHVESEGNEEINFELTKFDAEELRLDHEQEEFKRYEESYREQQEKLNQAASVENAATVDEVDTYFASALEFMYSQDSGFGGEMAFGSLNREQQEKVLKDSWVRREKEFFGEEPETLQEVEEESSDDIDRDSTIDERRKELNQKQQRVDELQEKIIDKMAVGAEATPGGYEDFEKCIKFFETKADQAEGDTGLSDKEAEEIDRFISKYENAAAITQVLWQLYFLKLEMQSEVA